MAGEIKITGKKAIKIRGYPLRWPIQQVINSAIPGAIDLSMMKANGYIGHKTTPKKQGLNVGSTKNRTKGCTSKYSPAYLSLSTLNNHAPF